MNLFSRTLKKFRGFSILEVAMASCVMAFGISGSIVGMQAGYKHIDLARSSTIATQIIQSEMERIRLMNYTMVSALPATETFDGATGFSSHPDIVGHFSVTRTVSNDATRPTEVKNISISVTWQTVDGMNHQRTFTAIYAKQGLYDYYYTIAHP